MVKHPAKYTDAFIPIFADLLKGREVVLDPFAGTGKISLIKNFGFSGKIICNEIEKDFADIEKNNFTLFGSLVDEWHIGDAEKMTFLKDCSVDAVCTSPTYGNRMADHFNAKNGSKYITYTHCIGHKLKDGNTGKMQFGEEYKGKHQRIYKELNRVLKIGGLFICNVSNFIKNSEEVDVVGFHKVAIQDTGFLLVEERKIKTPRMGFGANREKRVKEESILVFTKRSNEFAEHLKAGQFLKKC